MESVTLRLIVSKSGSNILCTCACASMGCSESKSIQTPRKNSEAEVPKILPVHRISVSFKIPQTEESEKREVAEGDDDMDEPPEMVDEENAEDAMDFTFITEHSEPSLVKKIERDFVPTGDLDLSITGQACPQLLSGGQKTRIEEEKILKSLIDEGLISKPIGRGERGLSYELVEDATKGMANIPTDFKNPLATLEGHRERFTPQTTAETINDKLLKAEARRKQNLKRGTSSDVTPQQELLNATEKPEEFAQLQNGLAEEQETKDEDEFMEESIDPKLTVETLKKDFSLLALMEQ